MVCILKNVSSHYLQKCLFFVILEYCIVIFQSVEEKCVYTRSSECSNWVDCHRQAWIDSGVRGISSVVSSYGIQRFKNNLNKTIDGFNHVLTLLYNPETHTTEHPKKSSEKFKEKASEMAKTVKSKVPRREMNSPWYWNVTSCILVHCT